ncbi:TadE/TadG family type IV pilus assembly protein [Devosia sp. ZW T5_3]|uniref:TadE/TadG family type IV pilus assembly protein n=1 Tax=Devosia sp. ZW T5_3 TaxID=3378085 RepID=UPI00385395CE
MIAARQMLKRLLRRFAKAQGGVAAVEFALVVPFMLMVYLGTTEAGALITMDRKVQSVAGAVGDLVARENGTISGATLQDYFQASSGIMTPYTTTNIKQIVTSVKVKVDGTTEVAWSREYLNGVMSVGTTYPQNQPYGRASDMASMTDIAKGSYVIVSEASYSYKPLYGFVFDQAVNLYRQSFYVPRFGEPIVLN